jgi:hypothetical protein
MRFRRSAAVVSRKLTVNVFGFGPQYLFVVTVAKSGRTGPPSTRTASSRSGALAGLSRAAI